MTQVGKNIKKIRNVRSLSQQAFADLFELTRGNISSYEEFRAEPKIEVIVRIAKYFGIPLADFIEKDLSVNELLHYNAELVLETEKLKIAQQLQKIPYIPALYINDYVEHYKDDSFFSQLPYIVVPSSSKLKLLALEVENQESMPEGFNFHNGDILVMEIVEKENIHRIVEKLGIMIDAGGMKTGIYKEKEGKLSLSLNEWVEYPFVMDTDAQYWVLRALYSKNL
ncbi:helix-turn-helix domain-containing protein [Dysgonomonas sp. 511]|uniref:helix-turn-helix domain-containing protein n=1 Tax=Dysgonomonas sp. 511 TaxID=2302930 RepID=UPI0013D5FB2C|nr:helix-turn-helix transcriptional regulator [Dysgonomonas sp. 511]NDV78227.1 XRE family transcriptional regulator [Dysgonomonas sp. 511]